VPTREFFLWHIFIFRRAASFIFSGSVIKNHQAPTSSPYPLSAYAIYRDERVKALHMPFIAAVGTCFIGKKKALYASSGK